MFHLKNSQKMTDKQTSELRVARILAEVAAELSQDFCYLGQSDKSANRRGMSLLTGVRAAAGTRKVFFYFLVITYEPLVSSRADHFGSTTIVVVTSSMMAGPLIGRAGAQFRAVVDPRADPFAVRAKIALRRPTTAFAVGAPFFTRGGCGLSTRP